MGRLATDRVFHHRAFSQPHAHTHTRTDAHTHTRTVQGGEDNNFAGVGHFVTELNQIWIEL